MTELRCEKCGRPLRMIGVQAFLVRGVEVDLAHCDDPTCPEFERTRSYNERPMAPEQVRRQWSTLGMDGPALRR